MFCRKFNGWKASARSDADFDACGEEFLSDVYGSSKGRVEVLAEDLLTGVPELVAGRLTVLDAGGGAGQLSTRLAALGNEVVLADPSQQTRNEAAAGIERAGVTDRITIVRSDIEGLSRAVNGPFAVVVLCHAVLEWLADPRTGGTAPGPAPGWRRGCCPWLFATATRRFSNACLEASSPKRCGNRPVRSGRTVGEMEQWRWPNARCGNGYMRRVRRSTLRQESGFPRSPTLSLAVPPIGWAICLRSSASSAGRSPLLLSASTSTCCVLALL